MVPTGCERKRQTKSEGACGTADNDGILKKWGGRYSVSHRHVRSTVEGYFHLETAQAYCTPPRDRLKRGIFPTDHVVHTNKDSPDLLGSREKG